MAVGAGLAGCSVEDYSGRSRRPDLRPRPRRRARRGGGRGGPRGAGPSRASPLGPRTTCAAATTSTTPSAGCRPSRRSAPTCSTPPASPTIDDIRRLVESVDRPVNVLALPGGPSVAELGELGVGRISVGGAFAYAALGAVVEAARELQEQGTYGFWDRAGVGRRRRARRRLRSLKFAPRTVGGRALATAPCRRGAWSSGRRWPPARRSRPAPNRSRRHRPCRASGCGTRW